jgi:hypothetical protein
MLLASIFIAGLEGGVRNPILRLPRTPVDRAKPLAQARLPSPNKSFGPS